MSGRSSPGVIISAAVAVVAALCVYAVRQVDADMYGYLAYGRLFLEHRRAAAVDPFAYTSGGTTWVAFEYLSQMALWMAYSAAGPIGLISLKCLLGGIAVFALAIAARTASDDPAVWIPAFLIGASAASRYFLFRPQLFTFACFAVFVAVIVRDLIDRRGRLWVLPILMLAWANAHGGFVAGLGVVTLGVLLSAATAAGETGSTRADARRATRRLALTWFACVAVTFVNPRGIGLWTYVLTELMHDTNRRYIAEWQPAFSGADPWSAVVLVFITVTLVVLSALVARQRTRVAGVPAVMWAASAVPLMLMSYASVRHVPLAAMWAVPVLALHGDRLRRSDEQLFRAIWLGVSSLALVPIVLTLHFVALHPRPEINADGRLLGFTNPCRVVGVMRANHLTGHVYNPLSWGSYLTWETYPAIRVSMDGRNISAFPRDAVEENLRFYSSSPTASDADAPVNVASDYLLVPATVPMATTMRADVRWQVIYEDSEALLFARAEKAAPPLSVPAPPCPAVLH